MAALDMDGQSETNKSPASTQHAGLFLEGASSPSHKKRHCLSAMSLEGCPDGLEPSTFRTTSHNTDFQQTPLYIAVSED